MGRKKRVDKRKASRRVRFFLFSCEFYRGDIASEKALTFRALRRRFDRRREVKGADRAKNFVRTGRAREIVGEKSAKVRNDANFATNRIVFRKSFF